MLGIVTRTGLFVQAGGKLVPLPAAHTPLGEAIAALVAAIDAGEVQPCPHCGRYACECELGADPHGDLSAWLESEIPF